MHSVVMCYKVVFLGYYCSVEKVKGQEGEDRVVIIMNGKFLPHVEQVKLFLLHQTDVVLVNILVHYFMPWRLQF